MGCLLSVPQWTYLLWMQSLIIESELVLAKSQMFLYITHITLNFPYCQLSLSSCLCTSAKDIGPLLEKLEAGDN